MDKAQKAALVRAWEFKDKILRDIGKLGAINPSIAYGCIRTAETIIDMMMVNRLRDVAQREKGGGENENTSLPKTPAP